MKYKVKISTLQKEYPAKAFYEAIASSLSVEESISLAGEDGIIETTLIGDVVKKNGLFILKYDECLEGMDGIHTLFKFPLDKPKEITIARTGNARSMLFFEEGKYHISAYNAGVMSLEVGVYAIKIENTILQDGFFEMNYIIDFNGLNTLNTTLRMEITKL